MPDTDSEQPIPRAPITKDDARLIAQEVLAEINDNFTKYVGRGIISMFWKAILLAALIIALWGWAHFNGVMQPGASQRPANH